MEFTVNINTAHLIGIVRANREEHVALYQEAVVNYRKAVEEALAKMLADYVEGREVNLYTAGHLPKPEEHTDDYDEIISMLESHTGEEITIEQGLYSQYVLNKWSWTRNFMANTASYTTSGRK